MRTYHHGDCISERCSDVGVYAVTARRRVGIVQKTGRGRFD